MNKNYKLIYLFLISLIFWAFSSNALAAVDCGKLNGVSLPCYKDLLSGNEGNESLPFYPYAKRENGCSIPPARPGANDTISMASININFTDICNKHDRCYYTVGTRSLDDCNIPFYAEMRARCEREIRHHGFTFADLVTFGGTRAGVLTACYAKADVMFKATAGTGVIYHTEAQKNQKDYLKKIKIYSNVPFWWSYADPLPGKHCVLINEPSKGNDNTTHTWGDNYLCSNIDRGIRWSYARPISGMRCTQLHESSSPHTWGDNYLCVPPASPIHFSWSSAGPDTNKGCIKINEPADPHTWDDNYLCY